MKFECTVVGNIPNSIRGLRHPYESYDKSDSGFLCSQIRGDHNYLCESHCSADNYCSGAGEYIIGKNDLNLAQRMIRAGTPNDKFLRQIFVSVDITAPLYW